MRPRPFTLVNTILKEVPSQPSQKAFLTLLTRISSYNSCYLFKRSRAHTPHGKACLEMGWQSSKLSRFTAKGSDRGFNHPVERAWGAIVIELKQNVAKLSRSFKFLWLLVDLMSIAHRYRVICDKKWLDAGREAS